VLKQQSTKYIFISIGSSQMQVFGLA